MPEPQDPLEDYLEHVELLAALTAKREELLSQRAALEARGHNVAALLASMDEHCGWLRHLISQQEALMDGVLQETARHANATRELFLAIADLMKSMQRLTPEEWALVPAENREQWRKLLAEFGPLREQWLKQLTPEERRRLDA
ncbi:hypothetical protein ACXR0O_05275 [Verrucomicrobiota bacterium sgz303538]